MSITGRADLLEGDKNTALDKLLKAAESLLAGLMDECTVEPEDADTTLWDTYDVSDLQENVEVVGDKISGDLKYIDSGTLATVWGAGYFLCLKFSDVDESATSVAVGLKPTEGSGMAELDEDMNAVFKITDKAKQKLKVVSTDGTRSRVQTYDLVDLRFAPIG